MVKNKAGKDGIGGRCQECNRKRTSEWYQKNKHKRSTPELLAYRRDWSRKRKFGITADEYMDLLLKQEGICAICGDVNIDRSLAVDHDHVTGHVRGLLCTRCNQGLGQFRDNIDFLKRAIEYLGEGE